MLLLLLYFLRKKKRQGVLLFLTLRSTSSLRKHPFLLALRRRGRFLSSAGNVPIDEERGETDHGFRRLIYIRRRCVNS